MYNICNIVYKLNTSLRDTPVMFSQDSHHLLCVEKPSSTNLLLLSRPHQSLITSSKTIASPCRACTSSTELDFGVALTHTHSTRGINVELAEEIKLTFSYAPPLALSKTSDDSLNDPKDFSLDELEKKFAEFEKQLMDHPLPDADGTEVLNGEVYDFDELDWVNQGEVPREDNKVITIDGTMTQATWDVEMLMSIKGIAAQFCQQQYLVQNNKN